jgi:hypothetical protein
MLLCDISRLLGFAEELEPHPRFLFTYLVSSEPISLSKGFHRNLEVS